MKINQYIKNKRSNFVEMIILLLLYQHCTLLLQESPCKNGNPGKALGLSLQVIFYRRTDSGILLHFEKLRTKKLLYDE